jgi:hypothetical protein
VNLDELDRILKRAGSGGVPSSPWQFFSGSTMTTNGDRGEVSTREFSSEAAMCSWLLARELVWRGPRPDAVRHESIIEPIDSAALWRLAHPDHSHLRARGGGLLAIVDTSGLILDPERGATQITIVDAATGAIRASWIPAHGAKWLRFEGATLVVDDGEGKATVCEPMTGRVVGAARPGEREVTPDPMLPTVLHRSRETSRLESPDGVVLWRRPGWVWSATRVHGLSVINIANASVVEAVRDDGSAAWTHDGILATVTADTAWIDAGARLLVVDIDTGVVLSSPPVPWSDVKLYGLHNGWDPCDGLVMISDESTLAAYTARLE